jgi:HK97 gp10 family phage protein
MSRLTLSAADFDRVLKAIEQYPGNAEKAINEVLHGQGAELIQERIRKYMPVSDKKKGAHAVDSASLTPVGGHLAVTVKSTNKFNYLYFPDDGTNTRRHVGNQQFFLRGAEDASGEIADIITEKLTQTFEEGV